jgi:hypothetical protein
MPSSSPGFYPPEFTERSRAVLQRVHEAVPDAVLIGGWGTWLRTGGPMSHDIDLIVTRPQLAGLTALVDELSESRHLAGRKWRGSLDGIHLDLYVPHQSRLGQHLQLRTEHLVRRTQVLDGWVVLQPAAHLATKVAALVDRPDSAPGDKDRHEIMALLSQGIDTAEAVAVIHEASVRPPHEVTALIDSTATSGGHSTISPGNGTTTRCALPPTLRRRAGGRPVERGRSAARPALKCETRGGPHRGLAAREHDGGCATDDADAAPCRAAACAARSEAAHILPTDFASPVYNMRPQPPCGSHKPRSQAYWGTHNPKVAGSNPAPATNV